MAGLVLSSNLLYGTTLKGEMRQAKMNRLFDPTNCTGSDRGSIVSNATSDRWESGSALVLGRSPLYGTAVNEGDPNLKMQLFQRANFRVYFQQHRPRYQPFGHAPSQFFL